MDTFLQIALPFLQIVLLLGGLAVLWRKIIHDTRRRGRWGIPLYPATCSRCGARQPTRRLPRSVQQALWGGHTCAGRGAELDKWGRELPAA